MSYRIDVVIYPRTDLYNLGWIDSAAAATDVSQRQVAVSQLAQSFVTDKRLQIYPQGDIQSVFFAALPVPFNEATWPAIATLLDVFRTEKRSQTPFQGDLWSTIPVAYFPLDPVLWPSIEAMLHAFRTQPRGGSVYNVDDTFIVDWMQGILLIGTFILLEDVAMADIGITDATMAPGAYLDNVRIVKDIDSVREGMVSG